MQRLVALWSCLSFSLALSSPSDSELHTKTEQTPIVLWHGMGDSCCNPFSMGSVKRLFEERIPGVFVHSLRIGGNVVEDTENGFFMNINKQIDLACADLKNQSRLATGFHAVGFSQGGLFLRGLVQRCPEIQVKNLVSVGGPQQGVYGIPHCLGENHTLCDYMRRLLNYGAYTSWVQRVLVQAQYWHDPLAEEEFIEKSLFLADINNQGPTKKTTYSANLAKLDKFLLVKFMKDSMVDPKESEWFGWFSPEDRTTIQPMRETQLYQEDWIGLQTLDKANKLFFMEIDGDHLQMDEKSFSKIIDEFLK